MFTNYGGFVYIMTNTHNTVLYVGVAASISTRVEQHRAKEEPQFFTARYNIWKLVYYEFYDSIEDAITREKTLKGYSRLKKIKLINARNPGWNDLYDEIKYL